MSLIVRLFGEGKDLDALQMGARAFVLFFMTLVLVRIGGMRAFGRKSSFDTIIVIMLGAVLSRAVAGVSPFWPTIAAATVLVVVHRAIGMLTARWHWLERVVKGHHHVLYRDGEVDWAAMRRAGITRAELDEAVRSSLSKERVHDAHEVYLESTGELTTVRRP
jgi:uncharacterized membrane protein YcaP (DUF421 family)